MSEHRNGFLPINTNTFDRVFIAVVLFVALALLSPLGQLGSSAAVGPHTAVIEVRGVIADQEEASADNLVGALREAFEDENTKGIVLRINSPGGSPVQSGYVYDEIKRLRALHPDVKVYAVIADIGASGAYYIASAADEIYADPASIVGSIGVIMAGFGLEQAADKLGVERRVFTAGENKGFLDSFSPVAPAQRDHIQEMLGDIHRQFIDSVREGRGDRLKNEENLFSGLVWTGARSVDLGLADKMGSVRQVAQEVFSAEEIVDFSDHDSFAERLAKRIGVQLAETLGLGLRESMTGFEWR